MNQTLRRIARTGMLLATALAAGCSSDGPAFEWPSPVTFDPAMLFPTDGSLHRAEDGVALPGGRLIVSDRTHGLRLVEADGSSAPFGAMRAAGYLDDPPRIEAAANGVSLEPDGAHVLVADVFGGGIYRVNIANGGTERVHRHRYGVNTARRDSTGAIWFTQSTQCTAETGEARMFAAVDIVVPDGALYRLGYEDGRFADEAELVRGGLRFANGFVLDEERGRIYVSETCGNRILRGHLDVAAGRAGAWSTLAELPTPDNLELDAQGRLWVASPLRSELGVVNVATGEFRSIMRVQSSAQAQRSAEFIRRGAIAEPRIELLSPELWEPLPGIVTGMILGPADDEVHYVTGLGTAIIRLPRAAP